MHPLEKCGARGTPEGVVECVGCAGQEKRTRPMSHVFPVCGSLQVKSDFEMFLKSAQVPENGEWFSCKSRVTKNNTHECLTSRKN